MMTQIHCVEIVVLRKFKDFVVICNYLFFVCYNNFLGNVFNTFKIEHGLKNPME
jgi:hypothetical protein